MWCRWIFLPAIKDCREFGLYLIVVYYFLIPKSNENAFIYLFVTQTREKETAFALVGSPSILYSRKTVYLQVD